jgi:hypothetical protein
VTAILGDLKINEISLVDRPANQAAKVLLTKRAGVGSDADAKKRATETVQKLLASKGLAGRFTKGYMDGQARTLGAALAEREERELLDALSCALYSIFNDDTITEADEAAMVKASFDEFLSRLQGEPAPMATKEARMTLDLSKAAPEVKAHVEKLEARIADLEKAAAPAPQTEEVLKGLPAEVRERIEKAERENAESKARIEKLEDERLSEQFTKRAESLPQIGKARDLGVLLKRASQKLDKADFEQLETVLKAANERIEKGSLFSQTGATGTTGASADTAFGEARERAQELVTKGEAKTIEQGIDAGLQARSRSSTRGTAPSRRE